MSTLHLGEERAQRYLDRLLDDPQRREAEAHLAGCDGCRLLVASYRALAEALDDLEAPPAPLDFTASVLRRIDEHERAASRERRVAAAILASLALVGAGLAAASGQTAWAPVLTRLGDLFGSAATGLHVVFDVAGPVLRALRLEIAAAAAGAAIPLLVALRRLSAPRAVPVPV